MASAASEWVGSRSGSEVGPDQIESVIARLATAGHEVGEVRASLLIQHPDLGIQDRPLPVQTTQNLLKKRVKPTELLSLARHQPCLLAVNIQDPATVMLQLVDPVGMADRLLQRR